MRPLEGATNVQINTASGRTITDIDRIEGGTLWEQKSATNAINRITGADETEDWIQRNITDKFSRYLVARQYLGADYQDANIGFEFTSPNADPSFKNAVNAQIEQLRATYQNINIVVRWH